MDSKNILKIPLNPRGAIELGQCPCDGCDDGWASDSKEGGSSCQDDCSYWKEWCGAMLGKNLAEQSKK